ncbi:hypothetical protein [Algibacter sp. 2305UL17-15]|uniref:lipoprotein n=1 Tax=Algibacter sp. 2305UL17-15 TaxID=3231268 RepID=UPI003457C7F0
MKKILFLTVLILFLTNCSNGDDTSTDHLISPSDANAISQVLVFPNGSIANNGNPLSPSSENNAPTFSSLTSSLNTSNGTTIPLSFSYSNANSNLAGFIFRLKVLQTFLQSQLILHLIAQEIYNYQSVFLKT